MPNHEEICQGADHEHAVRILLQSAVAHLGKSEHALDGAEDVLDLRPHFRLRPVPGLLAFIDDPAMTVATIGKVLGLWRAVTDHVLLRLK